VSGDSPSAEQSELEKSRTFENLRAAFADEAALVFRYLYYASLAEFEGLDRHAALFKELAEGGDSCVQGCFDFLKLARDPDSGIKIGGTLKNLESLRQSETRQHSRTYPEMAKTARAEGFTDVASWFDTLEKAKRAHALRLQKLSRG
jgi:rubrerythrin